MGVMTSKQVFCRSASVVHNYAVRVVRTSVSKWSSVRPSVCPVDRQRSGISSSLVQIYVAQYGTRRIFHTRHLNYASMRKVWCLWATTSKFGRNVQVQNLICCPQYRSRKAHGNGNTKPRKTPIFGFSSKWRRKLLPVWRPTADFDFSDPVSIYETHF